MMKGMSKKARERANVWYDETLVRYNNPVLKVNLAEEKDHCIKNEDDKIATQELINIAFPPKEWVEAGEIWTQTVSSSFADRLDVINLQELLDTRLQQRQAREAGICPIRRELFRQCLDELIRQIVMISPERSLLLLRVRDEARITMEAYQTLFLSSIAYGQRKALQAEEGISELRKQIAQLEHECETLKIEYTMLQKKYDQLEKTTAEKRQCDERIQEEQLNNVRRANAQFKLQLDGILYQKK